MRGTFQHALQVAALALMCTAAGAEQHVARNAEHDAEHNTEHNAGRDVSWIAENDSTQNVSRNGERNDRQNSVKHSRRQAGQKKNGFQLEPSLIPIQEIRPGGPPRDGIPAIYAPKFLPAAEARHVEADDRVLGVHVGGIAKAFPVDILDHHEVVNDWTQETHMVITYCPLCGSGMAFRAGKDGQAVFGVSGLLYNSDVLLYDHASESLWSQILGKAVTGPSMGQSLEQIPVVHTTWRQWLQRHPPTYVLSRDTGYRGVRYGRSPYRGYERTARIWFPVAAQDSRYRPKAWVLGIELGGVSKAYPFEELARTDGTVHDRVGDVPIVVRYDQDAAWIEDDAGALLNAVRLFWFAWYSFHPDTEVFVVASPR